MATSSKNKRKWEPWDGAFRAAGSGALGIHYGSHVYTLDAAKRRQETLAETIERTWIEVFSEGSWKRCGDVLVNEQKEAE